MKLEYETFEKAPQRLELEMENARVTLVFPLSPRWLRVLDIGMWFIWGAAQIVFGIYLGSVLLSMSPSFREALGGVWKSLLIHAFGGIVFMLVAWWSWRSYRRFGHLSRRLYVDESTATLGHRREGSARRREWPLEAVKSARLTRVRNPLGRPAGAALRIHFWGRGNSLMVQRGKKDVETLRRFAEELRRRMPGRVTVAEEIGE